MVDVNSLDAAAVHETDSVDIAVPAILADAVDLARTAVEELGEGKVGAHIGVVGEDEAAASHYFEADVPGYRGWQWVVVVATCPGSDHATVSEIVMLPSADAIIAPEWTPWDDRLRPGDLGPGDLLPPALADPRLVPGYIANGDPAVDDVVLEIGLGRLQVLSPMGRDDAADRWHEGQHGPGSEMARAATSTCDTCGFYLPLAGALRNEFGVCGNELSADGQVVHAHYGCGAHSDTPAPKGAGSPAFEPYDDGAVETTALRVPAAPAEQNPSTP
ncbi:DUF3027 domain-containing protein [Tomitella biformata]|uniref:DUF3027 domain-containing protein n=1 Tax=Tomitella biformata TaxID=630403 RepID=UPI0004BB625F